MEIKIRKSTIEDMSAVMDAHRRSSLELCSKDYSNEQVSLWSDVKYNSEIWENSVNNEYHLVVEKDGKVEGLCHAKVDDKGNGHIVGLYFTPVIEGKGLGRKAFEMAIQYLKDKGAPKISIIGTITAKGFYEKMGFNVVSKSQIAVRGTVLDCFEMEMCL